MRDLNHMRELSNVVNQLMDNPDMAEICFKLASDNLEFYTHNIGNSAIRGSITDKEINEGKASVYLADLIHSICMFIEDGNSSSITNNSSMYPNAKQLN